MNGITDNIFLFRNTREVLKAEKWCVENRIIHKIMPVPRHISSECGMCLFVDSGSVKCLTEGLLELNIQVNIGSHK